MAVRRVQHVSVRVPPEHLEACRRFYTEALEMEEIPALAGIAWFRFGDGDHIHLLSGPGAADSLAHFAVHVDDLEATLAAVRAQGLEPRQGDDLWGAQRWFVRDPAGNLMELFDVPPGT